MKSKPSERLRQPGAIPKGLARRGTIVSERQKSGAQRISLDGVWRNPLPHVQASLRSRQASSLYCRRAEQVSTIWEGGPIGTPITAGWTEQYDFTCRKGNAKGRL